MANSEEGPDEMPQNCGISSGSICTVCKDKNNNDVHYKWRILHECSCFIEFIKQVEEKKIKCKACRAFYLFFATSLINSIIQEHKC